MNYFNQIINFIFPREKINEEEILKLSKAKITYFSKKNIIIFLPYKNKFVKDAIWTMKFKNNFSAGSFFAKIIYENLPDILNELSINKNFNNPVIIQIPMSTSRKRSRGYNQNDIILKYFFKIAGNDFIKWEKNVLIKIKNTKAQSKIKNRNDRFTNIKNSFGLKNTRKIKGKNIILFDDVLTTGATLFEANKILKKAGAKKIIFMVLAH